jgi:hypothetical protein
LNDHYARRLKSWQARFAGGAFEILAFRLQAVPKRRKQGTPNQPD